MHFFFFFKETRRTKKRKETNSAVVKSQHWRGRERSCGGVQSGKRGTRERKKRFTMWERGGLDMTVKGIKRNGLVYVKKDKKDNKSKKRQKRILLCRV
mmetsp:Transcript_75290/g.87472  ORF Transcript_75290/g.87472 Transcript_75290/m.87472 type:complete len:98 (+) Transcript_75290:438-731(+)